MRVLNFPSVYKAGERPYDIFKDRVAAINSITAGIKDLITSRYYKQLNETMIEGLGKKISKDREAEKLTLYKGKPDESIYPSKDVMESTVGQFVDYSMGAMARKETMMGRSPTPAAQTGIPSGVIPSGTLPGVAPTSAAPSEEVMIPGMDKQQLLDYVMAGGEMDWSSILKVMEERPGFLGEYSSLELAAIEGVMGKDVMGEKIEGIERASKISEFFAPPEKKIAKTMTELAQTDMDKFIEIKTLEEELKMTTKQKNMGMYVDMYNRKEITYDSFLKAIDAYVAPAKLSDFEKKLRLLTETGMWETMSKDNKLKFFNAYVKPEEVEEKKTMYDIALTGSEDYFGIEDWIYINKKGFVQDEEQYRLLYAEYERGAKEIYERTGEVKPKKYLSLDETEKYKLPTLGEGAMGGYKPVLNTENIPWSWLSEGEGKKTEGEAGKEVKDKEDEFGYIIGATYKNPEGKLLKYLGNKEWENIKPGEASRKRG